MTSTKKIILYCLLAGIFLDPFLLSAKDLKQPVSKPFLMGKYSPAKHPDFVKVNKRYASKGLYLQKETYSAFKAMYQAAKQEGVTLTIRSGTRTFAHQKAIWERKWTGKRLVSGMNLAKAIKNPVKRAKLILHYSSMPGSSRHHWGTDIDLNAFNNRWFESGKGLKIYSWLRQNAYKFGFCQVYSKKDVNRPVGYDEEKWHWSYLPLARTYTDLSMKMLTPQDFSGFKGSDTAGKIGIINNYILGINPACK